MIVVIFLLILALMGCGGGGGATTAATTILTKTAAEQAASAVLSGIDLLLEPSYLGAVSVETKKKSVLEKLLLQPVSERAAGLTTAGLLDATPCSGGGSKTVSMTYIGQPESMMNVHAVISYSGCIEGSSAYNGTLETKIEGAVSLPSKVTSKLSNFTYNDIFTSTSLSFKDTTIVFDNAVYYQSGGIKSADVTIDGDVSGELYDRYLNAQFKSFKLKYEYGSAGLLYVNVSGTFTIPCIASELTVVTSADVTLIANDITGGSFYIGTANWKEKATISVNDKGEINITAADGAKQTVTDNSIASCKV